MQLQSEHNGRNQNTAVSAPVSAGLTWPAVDRRKHTPVTGAVPQGVYTLRSLVSMLGRRRYPLAAAFLLLFGAACAVSLLIPKRYEAEAKLMVKRARVDAPLTLERGAATTVPAEMTEAELSAEIELIRSRDLLEDVATACRLVEPKPAEEPRETLARGVRELEKGLKVLPVGKTNLISVEYSAAEPELAAEVVNRLVEGYLRKHVAVHRTGNTAVFFKSQADSFEKELNNAQQQLAGFRSKDGVSSLPDEKAASLRRVADLDAAVQEAGSAIRDADNRARLLRQQRASLPATIETGSRIARSVGLIERLKGQLLELENKRTELLTKYEPGYRLVREVEKQIRDTRAALEHEQAPSVVDRTDAPNPLRQSIEGDLLRTEATIAGLRARRASLVQDLARSRARLQKLDTLTGEHDDLQRRLKLAEENYLLYQKKEEESRLEAALDQQRILNVSVVERAIVPADPAPRHRSVILIIGFLVACFGAVAAAFIADYFFLPPAMFKASEPPAIRTRPVMAESIPSPAGEKPPNSSPQSRPPVRPVTNTDRAAFVAAAMEKLTRKMPDIGLTPIAAINSVSGPRETPEVNPATPKPVVPKPASPKLATAKPIAPKPAAGRQDPPQALPRTERVSCMRDRPPVPNRAHAPVGPVRTQTAARPPVPQTASVPLSKPAVAQSASGGRVSAAAYLALTSAAAPAMPPVATRPPAAPAPKLQPPAAPPKPCGFLGDYGGGSMRRLFDE